MKNKKGGLNQKIDTKLAIIIIMIFTVTIGFFVWHIVKNGQIAVQSQLPVEIKEPKISQSKTAYQQNQMPSQNDQISVAGIVNSKSYLVEDFLKQNSSISPSNVDLIKGFTNYDNLLSGNRHYAQMDIVNDNTNRNIIYFIDTRFHFQSSLDRPDIYKLNLSTNELSEIYKSTDNSYDIQLIGIEDNKLLFFKKGSDDSPGPCFNWWVDTHDRLLPHPKNQAAFYQGDFRTIKAIDLNNTNTGLYNFAIPDEKYKSELIIQQNCITNFNK